MKTIRIHLQSVEEAMLAEVQKKNPRFRNLEALLLEQIHQEYSKIKR
jgi:uncharacterized pyridoxamine 5'-phosphate oxidase family protein